MPEQIIPPNTFVQIEGTDLEVGVRGVGGNVALEVEVFESLHSEYVQVAWSTNTGEAIAIRAPKESDDGR